MRWFKGCADGAHRYEARYDQGEAKLGASTFTGGTMEDYLPLLEALRRRTYVRDVCVRCGKTIERHTTP